MADVRAVYEPKARTAARAAGIDEDVFARQIGQECRWDEDVILCRRSSPAGAQGVAQIVARFHPNVNPCDPDAALTYAASLMRNNLAVRDGDWALALAMYNAGPGATASGLKGTLPGWPYAETVRYVSIILQISPADATARLKGQQPVPAMKLSEVLSRARSRIGDPYVWGGKTPPQTDCSGFVSWCYGGQVPSFTDAILDPTERTAAPAPGDIVLWEYTDPDQPGVRFPHVGLYLDDATALDNRFGLGVGVHPQLPRARAARYYRRLPGVVVDTADAPPVDPAPAPLPPAGPAADPKDDTINGLRIAVAHLADVVVVKAAQAASDREAALAEAQAIRAQFVGPKP